MAEDEQPTSPLAEEAARLLGAVQQWTRQTFPAGRDGHGGPECEWCPLCQFMAVLRGERPEVTQRVAEAGAAVATAFRAVLEATPHPSRPEGDQSAPAGPPPRVQHIDLGEPE